MNEQETPTIAYRPLEKSDDKAVADLLSLVWGFDQVASKRTARQMAYILFHDLLQVATFSSVAIQDGAIVGIVLGRSKADSQPPKLVNVKKQFHTLLLLFTEEGKEAVQSFKRQKQVNEGLYSQAKRAFEGKLQLLAVHPSARTLGIGSHLYDSFIHYMNEKKGSHFYAFADNRLSYDFFEHKELKRDAVITRNMPFFNQTVTFYLYSKELSPSQTIKNTSQP